MGYPEIKAQIVVHAAAAGAALTNPILDAVAGFPVPKGRCIRVWYAGETAPERMGEDPRVLNGEMVAHMTKIGLFLPVSTTDEYSVALLDAELFTFGHELRTRILGDSQLGGASTDLVLRYLEADWLLIGNTRYLIGEWVVVSDYIEYALAP